MIDILINLGFPIKRGICILQPSQLFFFLGYLWDTVKMTCQLPEEKLENIKVLFRDILSSPIGMVKNIQRLMGCVTPPDLQFLSQERGQGRSSG